jgi:hypothetical protein
VFDPIAELGLLFAEFGAAFVDVADQFLVGFVDQFETADQSFALGFGVGDVTAQGGELLVAAGGGVDVAGSEQGSAVVAEHVPVEEGIEVVGDSAFADEERSAGWVPVWDVALLGARPGS